MDNEIIVGLDIGTTKVCSVVASADEGGRFNVLGVGRSPSDGLTRGGATNIATTVRAITSAVAEAESRPGIKIQSVIVGIAGDHIQSFQSRGVIAISRPENEITQADVHRLIEDTKRVALPSDRRIIHVIPQEFIIDGQDGVCDPVGMSGVRLEANVHIITGLVTAAQNIYKCVQRAGLHIRDMVLEPLASSYAVLEIGRPPRGERPYYYGARDCGPEHLQVRAARRTPHPRYGAGAARFELRRSRDRASASRRTSILLRGS